MFMDFQVDIDWQEIFEFQPGFIVELKSQPGVFDTVAAYEPMMVPPVWLKNDPCPRYPHELRVVFRSVDNITSPLQCELASTEKEMVAY
jgi:hypothetical protein